MSRTPIRLARQAVWLLTVIAVIFGVAGFASGGESWTTRLAVLPDLPEPLLAQFVPGRSPVVPPTAPPATDIRLTDRRSSALAVSQVTAGPGKYVCPGFSAISNAVGLQMIENDTFAWGNFAPYKVGNGKGQIDWKSDPYENPSWHMWLHSLRWLGQGVQATAAGNAKARDHVAAIIQDWVRKHPMSWKNNLGAYESTMHRTNVLICERQAVLTGLRTTKLPSAYKWLDDALIDHARFLLENWSGAWNHGTDESLALFGIGCTLGRSDYKQAAVDRLAQAITTSIDPEGSTNEQSTAYAQFNFSLWGRAIDVLRVCGADPGTTITSRRTLMANWLALATNSLSKYHQIGDSQEVAVSPYADTPLEFAGSRGTRGVQLTQKVGIYSAGYVFGRSGWGEKRPFGQEAAYSIRFGPEPAFHGHSDHMSITYTAFGRDILVDAGHAGYQMDKWRSWARSQFAHNVLSTPSSPRNTQATALTRSIVEDESGFYEFTDSPKPGLNRTRGVLVLQDPDLIVSLDRATSSTPQDFQALWHLPSDQKVTVVSPTTAVAQKPGDRTKTLLLQIPYQQRLPSSGALTVRQGETDPVQGWHYDNIFTREPAPAVSFNRTGTATTILSVIAPVSSTANVSYTTQWSKDTYTVTFTIAGRKTTIGITPGGSIYRVR